MNYFAALLLAAGLPATVASTSAPTPSPSFFVSSSSFTIPIASVQQSYYTMNHVDSALPFKMVSPIATGSPTTTPSGGNAKTSTTSTSQGSTATTSSSSRSGSWQSGSTRSTVGTPQSTSSGAAGGASTIPSITGSGSVVSSSSNSASQMIALINQARRQAGLTPYTVNTTLMTLAQERAVALANGPFTSDLSGYGWPVQMEQAAGVHAQGMGAENIAEASSVSQAFQLLMASPPHKSNILNPYETQIGVGVAPWGSGVAISELFIGPNN